MQLGYNFYVPESLVYYTSDSLVTWLNDYSESQNNEIVGALQSQTNTLQETQDYLTDDSISSSEMSVDTSQVAIDDNTGIDNYFSTYLSSIQTKLENYSTSEVSTITIPMPYNITPLVLRSDILSAHIPSGTFRTLITTFWYFIIGGYIVSYAYRMIKWLTTGRIFNEGGISDFIWYLDTNNEIIKSYMM